MANDPMRIGLASSYFPPSIGGVQDHIDSLSSHLLDRSDRVQGLTTTTGSAMIDDRIDVERITCEWSISDAVTLFRTARAFASDCDIVHVHAASGPFTPIVLSAARSTGTPTMFTAHGGGMIDNPHVSWKRQYWERALRIASFHMATSLVSTCSLFTDIMAEHTSREAIREIPEAVDAEFYTPGDADVTDLGIDGLKDSARLIVSVNMIKRIKGLHYIVQALPRILDVHPDAHYVAVGDGAWRDVLADMAVEHGVRDHVHFVGTVTEEERLRDFWRAADVAVVPSSGESTSISTQEAMATGTPVVATPVGGLLDLIGDEERGLLADIFPRGSYQSYAPTTLSEEKRGELAGKITWVLSHPEQAADLGRTGREYILKHHHWPVVFEQLYDEYRRLL